MHTFCVRTHHATSCHCIVNLLQYRQKAELGDYGSFTMTIYEDGTMDYEADIKLANQLFSPGATRKYHLHSGFLGNDATVGAKTPGDDTSGVCGGSFTLGHYDPFEACGPASTATKTPPEGGTSCTPVENYCSDKSDSVLVNGQAADACEVGDLSGRFGALPTTNKFIITKEGVNCPGCYDDYVGNEDASFKTWGSIVFHNGSPRVLCGNLVEV